MRRAGDLKVDGVLAASFGDWLRRVFGGLE
jgi:hypothetical protein